MERGFLVRPRSIESIQGTAHRLLDALQLKGHQVPILHVLEGVLPLIDETDTYSFEILEPDEMLQRFKIHAEGMTVHRDNLIALRSDVYAGALSGMGRHRFTAAHELGHYILHKGEGLSFPRRSTQDTKPYLDSEWQANVFAREFLVDIRCCGQFATPEAIAAHFCVSLKVAEIQWKAQKKWPRSGTI
ncbi:MULTISPECIES: ImmA/IrrE family metallo-endopeptidase [pseudomallei group]|uniref:ImmA/IrrE family metallo-endopeptidase n=1 Tax=pseudomallei group TaxID=111527 RepID=UPI000536A157|nr:MULTISPECIES: ImmA/IrrE family metallo-endopeptidase [pseudomallei group]KGW77242.1 hypothetical protein Y046_2084 [Burkholderia pseudomallei MSHR2990]MCS6477847.1 ImmA/IrrE family metallo-endopeptidase [Burkholderia thailandensis]CAJ9144083.1 Domain of uncharacterised function (DUF955) [Burkholderia pseudomallei]VBR71242.1 neutral zinc metallopeptidase [Burkholderia pseudomallei]